MADNTLTTLAQTFFGKIQEARRQANGFIPAVTSDMHPQAATLNDPVRVTINTAAANTTPVAGNTSPDGDASTPGSVDVKLTKYRSNRWKVRDEDVPVIERIGFEAWMASKAELSMLALLDEIDADIAALFSKATYGIGTPGTLPFASDFKQMAQLKRLSVQAGSPKTDLQLVLDPMAAANLRGNQQLNRLNESDPSGNFLRQGELIDISGFKIRESKNIVQTTPGAGSGYLTNGIQAKGSTNLVVNTGTGALVQGDWLTAAADPDTAYIANAYAGGSGTATIRGGLKRALPTGNAITRGASYLANMAFHRRAIALAIRPPRTIPGGGDSANETMTVVDQQTGLAFQFARYGQYLQATYETRVLWGVEAIEPELLWLLAG